MRIWRIFKLFLRSAVALMAALLAGGIIFWLFGPKIATGDDARKLMTAEQRVIAHKLSQLPSTASLSELNTILGQPIEDVQIRVRWNGPIRPDHTQVRAYYLAGRISKLTYISVDPYWAVTFYPEGDKSTVK